MLNKKNTVVEEKNKTEEQMGLIDKGNARVMSRETGDENIGLAALLADLESVGIDYSRVQDIKRIRRGFYYHQFFTEPVGVLKNGNWLVVYTIGGNIDLTLNPRITPLMVKDASISGYINGVPAHEVCISDSAIEVVLKKELAQLVTSFHQLVETFDRMVKDASISSPPQEQPEPVQPLTLYVANITRTHDGSYGSLTTIDCRLPLAA